MKSSSVQLKHKWHRWSFSQNTQKQNYWRIFSSMILCVSKPRLRKSIDKSTWHRHFLIFCMVRMSETLFHYMSHHKNNFKKKKKTKKEKWSGIKHTHWWLFSSLSSVNWKDTFLYTLRVFFSILSLSICRNSDFFTISDIT